MSLYFPIKGATKVQTGPLAYPNQSVQPLSQNSPNSSASAMELQIVVNGIGACSASVQFVGSNDGVNWNALGAPLQGSAAFADITPASASAFSSAPYANVGAYVTAISGTQASVTASVSA